MKSLTRQRSDISILIGRAGEYSVAAQLMLRGEHVLFPACDYGVDLTTAKGCRIQVKTAHISTTKKMVDHHGEGAYAFNTSTIRRVAQANSTSRISHRKPLSQVCDVVVFWGVEQNRFWIAPASVCEGSAIFILGRTDRTLPRFVGNVEDLREMVRLGYKHHEIGDKYGVGRTTITRLLNNPEFESREPDAACQVRQGENAWHLITEFERDGKPSKSLSETQQEVL